MGPLTLGMSHHSIQRSLQPGIVRLQVYFDSSFSYTHHSALSQGFVTFQRPEVLLVFCSHIFYLFFFYFFLFPLKWPQLDCVLKVFPEQLFIQMACLFSSSSGHQFLPDVLEGAECLAHSSSILWSLPCQTLWTASVLMLLPMHPSIFIHLRARDLDCFSFHVSFPIILISASSYFAVNFSPHSLFSPTMTCPLSTPEFSLLLIFFLDEPL